MGGRVQREGWASTRKIARDADLCNAWQYFPQTAVEHLENPFPVLTWHGVNMAEGLKALPSTYRFTHNQSGMYSCLVQQLIPIWTHARP